ncbi:Endoglucanase [Bacillus cereus Rock3-44]|nr:Endoglucanase [Bacillus cereus Rock3-44]
MRCTARKEVKSFLIKVSSWIQNKTNGNPSKIVDGYQIKWI